MILRVASEGLRCIIVAGHAPHTGNDQSEITEWWERLEAAIPKVYSSWPIVLLADANAVVGAAPTDYIGGHDAGPLDDKSEPFEDFVHRNGLWLPATFEAFQDGPGHTWCHTTGKMRRIDYVGLPNDWTPTACRAWVSSDIDPSITKTDHLAACVEIKFRGTISKRGRKIGRKVIDIQNGGNLEFDSWPHCDPALDVHAHAAILQDFLKDAVAKNASTTAARPKKSTMSDETWQIVKAKRAARQHLSELNKRQKMDFLQHVFSAWKHRVPQEQQFVKDYCKLTGMQDVLIAQALHSYRSLGRQVTSALRQDDICFYQNLMKEGAEFLAPLARHQEALESCEKIPAEMQAKKDAHSSTPPARLAVLEHQLVPHFCALELGEVVDAATMLHDCHERQVAMIREATAEVIPSSKLPSLTSFETSLRATASGKATGLDIIPSGVHHDFAPQVAKLYYSLLLKMHLWNAEPIQFKGGMMCLIPKQGNPDEASNYRGILLLASVAKRIHAMLRNNLMNTLADKRVSGQLGGFKHQMVQFGFHSVLVWTRLLELKKLSTAVLYVDLASAFHHLVRELVLGIACENDFAQVLQDLRDAGTPIESREHGQRLIGALEAFGCDSRILRLLRDVHTDTWLCLAGPSQHTPVRTRRGTRPGSPLADGVFHVIMAHIMREVREWISTQSDFIELLQRHDVPFLSVIWADDIAIPWATETATALIPAITTVVRHIDHQFARRGFQVNFALSKTNVVISFQGKHAPELRKQHLLVEKPGTIPVRWKGAVKFGFISNQPTNTWDSPMLPRKTLMLRFGSALDRRSKLLRHWEDRFLPIAVYQLD